MSEIVSFAEGTAQFATGNGSFVTQVYVRDVRLRTPRQQGRYRPPYSVPFVHVNYQNTEGTFSMTMLEGPDTRSLKAMLAAAAPGSVHLHVFGIIGNTLGSAGFYGYSGVFEAGELAGQEGNAEQQFMVNGWIESWSAY